MPDIDILVKASQEGLEVLDTAANKVNNLGDAATDLGNTGAGGINAMAFAVGQFVGTAALELIKQAPEIVIKLNDIGTASLRAKTGYEAIGGNLGTIQAMQDATKGLADDTDLLSTATELMSSKTVTTKADLIEFSRQASILGITFQGDVKKGIDTFATALESVGNVRSLRTLGIDTEAVKDKFEELKKTMDDKDAWRMAIFEEAGKNADKFAGNLDGTGTALDRLKVRFGDFVETEGEKFASWLDGAISKLEILFGSMNGLDSRLDGGQKVKDVGTRSGVDIDQQMAESAVDLYTTGKDSIAAYQSLVATYGQLADEMLRSLGSRPAALDKIAEESGGFQPYYARYIPDYGAKTSGGGATTTPSHGTGHSSQYGDVTGEGEGYGMYDQGSAPTPKRDAATIEKPKVTAAEFDAITRSAGQASAATLAFGAAGALAMGGLALSSAVAAGQIGNITTQGNAALSILKQLETQFQTLSSISINVTATTQGGGSTGSSRGTGRAGGVQGPPR